MSSWKQPMTTPIRPWTDGKPYYCTVCGVGRREYEACERTDCKLETKAEAQKRVPKNALPPSIKNQPFLIGRKAR